MASKVYFTDFRSTPSNNLLRKLQTLVTRAGIETIDFERKIVAIKIHFGEPGNLAYLSAQLCSRNSKNAEEEACHSFPD